MAPVANTFLINEGLFCFCFAVVVAVAVVVVVVVVVYLSVDSIPFEGIEFLMLLWLIGQSSANLAVFTDVGVAGRQPAVC